MRYAIPLRLREKLRSFEEQLFWICLVIALLFAVVAFSSSIVPRIIFAFPVIFLFPGYSLLLALYPKKEDLRGVERLLLSLALSLAIVPLILLILNYTWSLSLYPALASITLFILAMSTIAWWRQRGLTEETRFAPSFHFRRASIKLSGLARSYRFFLWLLLIALTISIVVFPVNITLDASPVQSLNVFASFPLFAVVFLIWMALLLFLLFSKKEYEAVSWQRLALVGIFALVFVTFWASKTFYQGGDSISMLSLVRYLQEAGRIPGTHFQGFDFPGVYLFTNLVAQVTGLDPFGAGYLLRIFTPVLSVALLYVFYANSLKNSYLASAALLLSMMASLGISTDFRPNLLANVFLFAFLVISTRDEHELFKTVSDRLIMIILLMVVTVTYFMGSMAFFFILAGIYVTQQLGREKPLDVSILGVFLVVILSWEMYYAVKVFDTLTGFIPMIVKHITTEEIFTTARVNLGATVGQQVPLWAVATRYFKWVFFYGSGTVLALIGLLRARKLGSFERREIGGLLGILFFAVFAAVLSPAGHEYYRYLMYASIFLGPIIIKFCVGSGERWRKGALSLLLVLLLVLSLPSFLISGSSVSNANVSPQDIAAGKFLNSKYGNGDGLYVFSNGCYGSDIAWYYLPNATHRGLIEYKDLTQSTVRGDVDGVMKDFLDSGQNSIFIYSERWALSWYINFGVELTDPHWLSLKKQLSGENGENTIFDNEYIHVYRHP